MHFTLPPLQHATLPRRASLPDEPMLLVLRLCSTSALKTCRLASRNTSRLATPLYWRKVAITPDDPLTRAELAVPFLLAAALVSRTWTPRSSSHDG